MLLPDELFRLALLLLLMGFAGMAALNTLEVWRSRTAVVDGRKPRPFSTLERGALVIGVAGVVAMGASSAFLTALPREGVLLGTPPDVRAVLQIPTREVEGLRAAGTVPLDLLGKRFTERRFSGRLVDVHPVEGRPSWSMVEIAGMPHSDAMVAVGATPGADPVMVELAWSPPVQDVPLFRTGIVLALAGVLLFPAARITLAVRRTQEDPA